MTFRPFASAAGGSRAARLDIRPPIAGCALRLACGRERRESILGTMRAVRVVVSGRVQGVGFRAWVAREATGLGLTGRVWNRPDGGVEAEAVGEATALERFVAALRQGPRLARVDEVVEQWFECREAPRGFQVTG